MVVSDTSMKMILLHRTCRKMLSNQAVDTIDVKVKFLNSKIDGENNTIWNSKMETVESATSFHLLPFFFLDLRPGVSRTPSYVPASAN